jgi:hypothetical protein
VPRNTRVPLAEPEVVAVHERDTVEVPLAVSEVGAARE